MTVSPFSETAVGTALDAPPVARRGEHAGGGTDAVLAFRPHNGSNLAAGSPAHPQPEARPYPRPDAGPDDGQDFATAFGIELGVRRIRTAGKGSGSVELTLPGALRQFVGLPCRVLYHDGARPDIVLQPDLSAAMTAFAQIWHALAQVFASDLAGHETAPFPAGAFAFALQPRSGAAGAPLLCWQDGVSLAAAGDDCTASSHTPGQHCPSRVAAPVARVVAACAAQLAAELGIAQCRAGDFGAACGYLCSGTTMFPSWQEPCDIIASAVHQAAGAAPHAAAAWRPGAALVHAWRSNEFWAVLTPGLVFAARLFAGWSQADGPYPALRAAWRRGHEIEMNRG